MKRWQKFKMYNDMSDQHNKFWEKPLDQLSDLEWEALCDGCGLCCLVQIEDMDTPGHYDFTRLSCQLYDIKTGLCCDYQNRHNKVPSCKKVTPALLKEAHWLPASCAYRLRYENKPLYNWHYLISGDRELVKEIGFQATNFSTNELDVEACEEGGDEILWEDYIIADPARHAQLLSNRLKNISKNKLK